MSKLVIVESPAKAKTIKKYLGSDFEVVASMGHIRDLNPNRLSVDIKKKFTPKYELIKGKEKLADELVKLAKKSDYVYLATEDYLIADAFKKEFPNRVIENKRHYFNEDRYRPGERSAGKKDT